MRRCQCSTLYSWWFLWYTKVSLLLLCTKLIAVFFPRGLFNVKIAIFVMQLKLTPNSYTSICKNMSIFIYSFSNNEAKRTSNPPWKLSFSDWSGSSSFLPLCLPLTSSRGQCRGISRWSHTSVKMTPTAYSLYTRLKPVSDALCSSSGILP